MSEPVRLFFLGGLGEVGRNMLVIEAESKLLVVDCGLSFPNDEMLGVDLVLPDFSYVADRAKDCLAVVLTHGHEDHVGALSWFLKEVPVPVYATPLTLGLAGRRLKEWNIEEAELNAISAPGNLKLGPFDLSFFAMCHSIPDAVSVVINTSQGRIFYTSDFKLDETPVDGRRTDLMGLARVAEEGIDVMLSDSTNAEVPGRTPSEAILGPELKRIFEGAGGKIVLACFASNLHRIQQVLEVAETLGKKVAFVGRSMIANVEVGRELGHLRVSNDTIVSIDDLSRLPEQDTIIVCTGSQGEPLSALSLIAAGEHKMVSVQPGDTVVLSASPIPGNESAVHRVLNGLFRAGAEVFHSGLDIVHVSGHGASEELAELALLMKPRYFVPVHGEYRQLATHARVAEEAGVPYAAIRIIEDGDVLELEDRTLSRGKHIPAGTILVDGLGVGDVGPVVLRDRKVLAGDGILVCVVTIDGHTGEVLAGPDLISRGFVYEDESRELLDEAADKVADALHALEDEKSTDWAAVKKACRRSLGEFVWNRTRRRPMILPIVMEI
ncbi:MAG TPA: ribonuclease J [Actinomycetota bacterium]|nr:ribonuclease J [Actinomycetota bacterium]